jgi:hypothetical protein
VTATYLQKSLATTLDANGNGTVSIGPDVTQWWTPRFCRVSTGNGATPVPYCAIYHGPKTVANFATFVDDTLLGGGDTSSMISGVLVQNGEAITAKWTGGTPGDAAILTLYGVSSDMPPPISDMPTVPGTHFSGKPPTEMLNIMSQLPAPGVLIPGSASTNSYTVGPFDVRTCMSYYFNALATVSGAATKYNAVNVNLKWSMDSAGQNVIYQESFEWWANSSTAGWPFAGDMVSIQDAQHGPYLTMIFSNGANNNPVTMFYTLICSTRILSSPYAQQGIIQQNPGFPVDGSVSGLIMNRSWQFGASGQVQQPMPFTYGRVHFQFVNAGAGTMTFLVDFGSDGTNNRVLLNLAGNTNSDLELVLPKRAGLLTIQGTNGQFVGARIITLREKV